VVAGTTVITVSGYGAAARYLPRGCRVEPTCDLFCRTLPAALSNALLSALSWPSSSILCFLTFAKPSNST
jgi:hypothetical protein